MGSMTNRNACKGAWVLVLVVLVGGQLGIAADDDQPGRRQSTPDLSGVSSDERRMIESACFLEKSVGGPAAYNRCLASQLRDLNETPTAPDLSGVSSDERRMIESACFLEKSVGGPAAYNRCLASQLRDLNETLTAPDLSGVSSDEQMMADRPARTDHADSDAPAPLDSVGHRRPLNRDGGSSDESLPNILNDMEPFPSIGILLLLMLVGGIYLLVRLVLAAIRWLDRH